MQNLQAKRKRKRRRTKRRIRKTKETPKEGLKEGLEKGKEEGLKEGLEKGKEEGLKEGIEKGKEEGLKEGLEKGKEEGLKEGIEKGKEEGKNDLLSEIGDKQTALKQLIEKINDTASIAQKLYKPIIDLSFHLAKEIVRAELNLPQNAITKAIENHLATIEQKGRFPVELRLNNKDIILNKEFFETLPENITLIEDKSLNQGDIQLKISEGKINDFIKTKESNLRKLCNKYLESYSFEETKETPTQSAETSV